MLKYNSKSVSEMAVDSTQEYAALFMAFVGSIKQFLTIHCRWEALHVRTYVVFFFFLNIHIV